MSLPKIDFGKVKTLSVEGSTLNVWYKSGAFRKFDNVDLPGFKAEADQAGKTIHGFKDVPWCQWCNERPALPGYPCDVCQQLGADPAYIEEQTGLTPESPNALAEMLGLTPEQAQHLEGADRLNFWRNGSLNVQVQHGSRGVKLACPKASASDADLITLFQAWDWQQLCGKLYFKPTTSSLVQL